MSKTIGPASEFYRLRITHLDITDDVEFDWRDDVLWRTTPPEPLDESDAWLVEAVTIEGPEIASRLGVFGDPDDARDFLSEVEEDLVDLTKSQFEAAWLEAEDESTDSH